MIIYKATNKETGRFYIGQTKDIDLRKQTHKQSVFAKANPDTIEWEILDTANNRDELNELEKYYIEKLKPDYNTCTGGRVNEGLIKEIILKTPNDFCFTYEYFKDRGITKQLVSNYVSSGWLVRLSKGLYHKAFNEPDIVYACVWNGRFHIGGRSALERNGLSHYVRFNDEIHIYTNGNRAPDYLKVDIFNVKISQHTIFKNDFGVLGGVSSPERAIIEMIYDIPRKSTLEECRLIMDGLTTLRPNYLQALLEGCTNIGTKRVFLYLARESGWGWYDKIDKSKIDLGNGKRSIIKGGTLDNEFNIVI